MRTATRQVMVLLVSLCTLVGAGLGGSAAIAAPVPPPPPPVQALPGGPWGDFYDAPYAMPANNGDIIRTQPSWGIAPATATRFIYRSTDMNGKPVAVSGTMFSPGMPWMGHGPRPLVSLAAGTQGAGRQCAPSMMFNSPIAQYYPPFDLMASYEQYFIDLLLAEGVAVVFTDYQGLGMPGPHTYVDRRANAHAVLDAARAAFKIPGTGLAPDSPVGLWGYSEGGGAVAGAAELQHTYAPDVNLKGVYAGAPPADLITTLAAADGSLFAGAIGYALNGFMHYYPELAPIINKYVNDHGRAILAQTARQCDLETMQYGFQRTSSWTTTGESLAQIIAKEPTAQRVLDQQYIGRIKPAAPVFIASNINDDLVPNSQVQQLAASWCGKGADVQYAQINLPPLIPGTIVGHVLPVLPGNFMGDQWLLDRFNGVPTHPNCQG